VVVAWLPVEGGREAKLEIDKNWPPVLRWVAHIVARDPRLAFVARLSLKETPHGQ
jgi:hypothetical protein